MTDPRNWNTLDYEQRGREERRIHEEREGIYFVTFEPKDLRHQRLQAWTFKTRRFRQGSAETLKTRI